jgi:hypothetical protein
MKITEHFSTEEFERSETAMRLGIDNTVPNRLLPNIQALCENVLEPLRQQFDEPVYISSGYRCPRLNKAVNGAKKSQHMKGQAADIYSRQGAKRLREWYLWMVDNLSFDQLIWETRDGGRRKWIHVSYVSKEQNRQQVFSQRR